MKKMKKIVAIGIIAILVCSVGLVIAQNQSEDVAASTSLSAVGEKNYTYEGKSDSKNITKLRQEIEAQMEKLDDRERDLIKGKYDRPPGVKEYKPPKGPLPPVPTPPVGFDRYFSRGKDENETCAGYQGYGGDDFDVYCGRVWCRTNTVPNLLSNIGSEAREWHVLHQVGSGYEPENCVVITRNGDTGIFQIFISELGGYTGDHKFYPADHTISIGIRPNHEWGHREYTTIYFWVWDRTTDEFWGKTYNLPETELIYKVDGALEHNRTSTPNSLWKSFHLFSPCDQDVNCFMDLEAIFRWKEWSCPNNMNNEHAEDYYHNYKCMECSCGDAYFCFMYPDYCYWYEVPCEGPLNSGTMWQRKTPK
jgi:hypothetical protein